MRHDAFGAFWRIFAFHPQAQWICHTRKPLYVKFRQFIIKTTSPILFSSLFEKFYSLQRKFRGEAFLIINACLKLVSFMGSPAALSFLPTSYQIT